MWNYNKLYIANICLLFSLLYNCDAESILAKVKKEKQKVCVIGAGAAGLASVKQLADHLDEFDIVAFEKYSDVGGLWIYHEQTDVDEHGLPMRSPVYKHLTTNVPTEMIAYPDYRHWNVPKASFVSHESVLSYLRNFTDHFNLRQYVKFNMLVQNLTTFANETDTKYEITAKDLNTNEVFKTQCDAVMVANGCNSEPNIPNIPGLENFTGKVIHSVSYRVPEEYTNKTVAILGAAASGIGITIDLFDFAKKIYVSHSGDRLIEDHDPSSSKAVEVSRVAEADGNTLILTDGEKIKVDAIIFCTGYIFYAPFLDETSGITVHEKYIYPLYKYTVNAKHPTMGFVGMTRKTLSFPSFYVQARYFVQLLRGYVTLPSEKIMLDKSVIISEKYPFKKLSELQYYILDELAREAKFERVSSYYITFIKEFLGS